MSPKTLKLIRLIIGIVLSALLVMMGVLFIVGCLSIYQSGDRPFTPESVGTAFARIEVIFWISLAITVLGSLICWILPQVKAKSKITTDKQAVLDRLTQRLNGQPSAELVAVSAKERRLRIILPLIASVLSAAAFIPAAVYIFDPQHFTLDSYNQDTMSASIRLVPAFLVSAALFAVVAYLREAGLNRRIALTKEALKAAPNEKKTLDAAPKKEARPSNPYVKLSLRLGILVIGIVFIVLGVLNGGMADVLSKAINICTECIGLG